MRLAIKTWTKKNGLPSMPQASILDLCHHLWSEHTQQVTNHITKSTINQLQSTFEGAIFHCEDKHASSLRIYCPCLYYQSIESTFQDPSIFEQLPDEPSSIVASLVESLHRQHGKAYPWAVGSGRQLPAGYILAKRKKDFRSGRPIISFVESPFRPMLNILARLIFQLIPSACPDHFATGDVYTLLSILREAPVDADLILVNQDLAGFFTSIDQERFIQNLHRSVKQGLPACSPTCRCGFSGVFVLSLFFFSLWLCLLLLFLLLCSVSLCFFLAASWLNLRSLFPSFGDLPPDGSCSSWRFPSPPGSGSDAFELFGGAPSLFRALH